MRRALWPVLLIAGLGLLLSACGSGGAPDDGDDDASTGTVRSERAEREASIMQQQGQVEVSDAAEGDGVIDFGHREGLPYTRNVVGDPDAPVLIVEYSDFQ
ncbi:MAG: hypothetical protein OXS30_05390 [Chloroflexota bacterium]|nr:hypothetical protein [Chloroflexota bacterium]